MKYFENLPETTFNTTIGSFVISNFFTYLDFSDIFLETSDINVDSKTHLLEASAKTYSDPNSFWAFLIANKTINPFDLLSDNVTLFTEANKNKINFKTATDTAGTTGIAFPQGTIILPYASNTGDTASFTSIGNFDLNGPFAVVDSVSYYGGAMVIKDQKGATYSFLTPTGATGQRLTAIFPNGTSYSIDNSAYVTKKEAYVDKVIETKKPEDGKVFNISPDDDSLLPIIANPVSSSSTTEITVAEAVELKSKNIKAFLPSDLGLLRASFITVKYS